MLSSLSADSAASVRAGDRDRYFASLLVPEARRGVLMALHAYDLALLDVVRQAGEPHVGLIRLAWWRDAGAALPAAGHPLLAALAATDIAGADLAALAEAYMDRIEGDESGACGARLFGIAARLLGGGCDVSAAGAYWCRAGDRRAGVAVEIADLPSARFPAALRPITALAAVSRRDIAGIKEPRGSLGRQVAILRHILTGRV